MKHGITAALSFVVICSQALPVFADTEATKESHTTESVGVVSGLVIGAALGGPPGAILSAAAGGWIGDQVVMRKNYRAIQAQLEKTEQQLANAQVINGALQQKQLVMQQQLTDAKLLASTEQAATTALTACCNQSEVVLHFRSNSEVIEPHYQQALERFVSYSSAHPDRNIEITGFADRRGDTTENLFLSQRRVETVVKTLRDMGLSGATFKTVAYGEREPVSGAASAESNFFDRRVVLRLSEENQSLLSSAGQ